MQWFEQWKVLVRGSHETTTVTRTEPKARNAAVDVSAPSCTLCLLAFPDRASALAPPQRLGRARRATTQPQRGKE